MGVSAPFQLAFVLAFTIEFKAYGSKLFRTFGTESLTDLGTRLIGGVGVFAFVGGMKFTGAEFTSRYCFSPTGKCFIVQIEIYDSPVQGFHIGCSATVSHVVSNPALPCVCSMGLHYRLLIGHQLGHLCWEAGGQDCYQCRVTFNPQKDVCDWTSAGGSCLLTTGQGLLRKLP